MTVCCCVLQGLICYKPVDQESCFLRKMEKSDYDNVHSLLHESTHKVATLPTRENMSYDRVSLAAFRICETYKALNENAPGQMKKLPF